MYKTNTCHILMKRYFGVGLYKNYGWVRCCHAALGLKIEGPILSSKAMDARWQTEGEFYEMEPPHLTSSQGRVYGQ